MADADNVIKMSTWTLPTSVSRPIEEAYSNPAIVPYCSYFKGTAGKTHTFRQSPTASGSSVAVDVDDSSEAAAFDVDVWTPGNYAATAVLFGLKFEETLEAALTADVSAEVYKATGIRAVWMERDRKVAALFSALGGASHILGSGTYMSIAGETAHPIEPADIFKAWAVVADNNGDRQGKKVCVLQESVYTHLCQRLATNSGANAPAIGEAAARGQLRDLYGMPLSRTIVLAQDGSGTDYLNAVFAEQALGVYELLEPTVLPDKPGDHASLSSTIFHMGCMMGATEIQDTAGVCLEAI